MIQYKLIKEYPDSQKLGTINWFKNSDSTCSEIWLGCDLYRKNPEFWQKVEEVDYEILSFLNPDGTKMYVGKNISKCWYLHNGIHNIDRDMDWMIKNNYIIESVKRLSDGEVFTIGDKLHFNEIISEFIIDNSYGGGIAAKFIEKSKMFSINVLQKITKTPLFTTEDGVEIFEGDSYVKLNNYSDWSIVTGFNAHGFQEDYKGLKFSTKEKAEEYIINNKPCLSLVDVIKDLHDLVSVFAIKEKVKNKLQL